MPNGSFDSVRIFWPKLSREELLRILRERIPKLAERLPLVRVVLFGSYAQGTPGPGSDVDLLVVYRGPPREEAFELVWRILNIPRLEPHVYTEEEYAQLRETLDRMCSPGILVYPPNEVKTSESPHGRIP
ncbi:MAG: nucleotidyltransferase domain-containing protein [Candidatus Bipolaricaulota bacterium]|nr:nucleotidyltransferase domain-containing protein [Candidatus Bipolaricaulota bacterium]MDW8127365.1 nucleotidyltransferase domain-containing protein [Candidatus Bipolaricaulota bacterium]